MILHHLTKIPRRRFVKSSAQDTSRHRKLSSVPLLGDEYCWLSKHSLMFPLLADVEFWRMLTFCKMR